MKNMSRAKSKGDSMELNPEYSFDYAKAKPNRFASRSKSVVVLLDADVSAVFKDGASVNAVLRTIVNAMPQSKKQARSKQ